MKRRLVCAVLALASSACSVEESVSEKELAKDLLNKGRYDQAIAVLKPEVEARPDAEGRILLASAYAGSVGFNVIAAFALFEPLLFDRPGVSLTQDAGTSADDDLIRETYLFLDSYSKTFGTISGVPHVAAESRGRLVAAIDQLHAVDSGAAEFGKARAYAGVLQALQFLNYMRDSIAASADGRPLSFMDLVCRLDIRGFSDDVDITIGYFVQALADLETAHVAQGRPFAPRIADFKGRAETLRDGLKENTSRLGELDVAFTSSKAAYCR